MKGSGKKQKRFPPHRMAAVGHVKNEEKMGMRSTGPGRHRHGRAMRGRART
jgi:hypothetical protein